MTTVANLLDSKGHDIWSVEPDATVYEAIKMMADKGVGALLVVQGQKLVGILSERDYARKVILQDRSSKSTAVREIMTEKVIYVRPEQTVEDAMTMMTTRDIRHLPVMQGDELLGLVSIGDLVRSVIANREHLIEQLENYITGR